MRAMLVLMMVAGCGNSTTGPADMSLSDVEVCTKACTKLTACGVPILGTCASDCTLLPVYLACVRGANLDDCNATAACGFKLFCNGNAPMGAGTCKGAADCEGACVLNGMDCTCSCMASMSPTKTVNLAINNSCAFVKCGNLCGPGKANGTACLACFSQNCSAEAAQCQSN